MSATHTAGGGPHTITYPTGRKVKYDYWDGGWLKSVVFDSFGTTSVGYSYYAANDYWAAGTPKTVLNGNGVTEHRDYNPRLQMNHSSATAAGIGTFLDKAYNFLEGTVNNGNIAIITDNLWNSKHSDNGRTQYFTYDALNRICSGSEGPPIYQAASCRLQNPQSSAGRWAQNYSIDPWANLYNIQVVKGMATGLDASGTQQNRLTVMSYDSAGNQSNGYSIIYDAENRITSANNVAYYYDADGQRNAKLNGSEITSYVYFGGQPAAERLTNGDWTDYIYAGSQRIARADNYEHGIYIHGNNNAAGLATTFGFPQIAGLQGAYQVQTGDKLVFRQWQNGITHGGMMISFTNGTSTNWVTSDEDGQLLNSDNWTTSDWHNRRVDLGQLHHDKVIANIYVLEDVNTGAGFWEALFSDIVIVSADGTVHPIYTSEPTIPTFGIWKSNPSGTTNEAATDRHLTNIGAYPSTTTNYYHSDHLGSTRLLTNYYGYPIWQGTYLPYGEEYDKQITTNHYQFTGKERDSETGLDYFGARYYGSTMGRWMSPDPIFFQAEMLTDPQRFNLYSYVRNSPLNLIDPKGEAIELSGDEEQRRKQLEAAKNAVGKQAGAYLYENKVTTTDANGNTTTRYFVGVYTNGPDGKGPAFGSINSASEALGNIISDSRVAQVDLVSSGTTVRDNEGNSAVIGPIPNGPNAANTTPGATYIGQDGKMHVTLLDTSSTSPGQLPSEYMSNHQPGIVDAGILFGHEFGHVRYQWGGFWRQMLDSSNGSAVRLENDVRKTRDPNAATRTQH